MCSALPHAATLYVGGMGEIWCSKIIYSMKYWVKDLCFCPRMELHQSSGVVWSLIPKLAYFQRQETISTVSISPSVVWLFIFPVISILDSVCELFSEQSSAFAVLALEIEEESLLLVVKGLCTYFQGGFGDFEWNNTLIYLSTADVELQWAELFIPFWDKCTTVMWVMLWKLFTWTTDYITAPLWDLRRLHLPKSRSGKLFVCRLVNALGLSESLRLDCTPPTVMKMWR